MSLSRRCIERPIATALASLGIVLAAYAGCSLLPIAALPQVDFPTIEVNGALPGASPETMAATVAAPLEQQLQQIAGLTDMTSTSTLGVTSITLQFDLSRNIDSAAQDVQKAINAAAGTLPRNMPTPPTYSKVNPAQNKVLTLALTSDSMPLRLVDEYATQFLIRPLSQLPGVGIVDTNGQQTPAIRVQANPTALASRGLTLEDVRAALAGATVDGPKGILTDRYESLTLDSNDQILTAQAANDVVVAFRDGAPVRVRDIGRAISSVEDDQTAAWYQHRQAILVDIHLQPGTNLVSVINEVKARLPTLLRQLPPSITVNVLGDRSVTVRAAISDMKITLAITIGLVVTVIFLFLRRAWPTLIPSVAIPVSLICAGGAMYLFGYSLDNLSFMGLAIAVGFVVDDAIVMIENISRHVEAGEKPMAAATRGASEITFTILSMTASLIAVFLPLLLMPGLLGRMFREFAVTVSVALVASAVVSLTLTPMMCSRLMGERVVGAQSSLGRALAQVFDSYRETLQWALEHERFMIGVFAALLAASIGLFIAVPKGFIPEQDVGIITGSAQFDPEVSFLEAARLQQAVARIVMQDPDVRDVSSFIEPHHLTSGRMYVDLKPFGERHSSIMQVIARLRPRVARIAGVQFSMQPIEDIQVGAHLTSTQYQYSLHDADTAELYHWAPVLMDALERLPQLRDVVTDLEPDSPHAAVVVDRQTAARLGITTQQIDDTLYDAFGQRQVATLYTAIDQFHIILEVPPRFRLTAASLQDIYLRSSTGSLVPLSAISRIAPSAGPQSINHEGQFPAVTLSFNLAPGVSLGQAVRAVQAARQRLGIPASVRTGFQGTARAFQASLASEPYLILAGVLAVYIVLGMLYESTLHPVTILSTLPSAGAGALAALMLTGNELDVVSLVGLILLIGIVQKNAIMMIDFAIDAQKSAGLAPQEAIHRAAVLRFRPIMMTTLTALLGSLPLALGHGAGSELRRPLGIAVVGGLAASQLLTLYTTPVVFIYMERLRGVFLRAARTVRERVAGFGTPLDRA
jgi:HAE1 family hydrophobic/amphiphilic exporter-1/multidrug efflux pump